MPDLRQAVKRAASPRTFLPLLAALLYACAPAGPPASAPEIGLTPEPRADLVRTLAELPPVAREFRGVWVATVRNMDWPTRRGLPVERQKHELLVLLDSAAALNLNAVVFQVRPNADALYHSELEPWSVYLTGESGRAPEPLWDPLEFAIEEAHRRGLQLHAWFNPFRARDPSVPSMEGDIVRSRPGIVKRYGPYWWMDPGEEAAQAHALRVIRDVVRRYDVDGVHIDDYFYPYRESDAKGRTIPFPDDSSYARYRAAGGTLGRSDWRRSNIDRFVEAMYGAVKQEKPWVQVGISPFGIWRPGHPAQIRGLDSFVEIFADSRKWLREGWLDYLAPQLYWRIDPPEQSFPVLLRWWAENNPKGRHIWPGLFTDRVGSGAKNPRNNWEPEEILGQIGLTRADPGSTGHIHFNWRTLARSPKSLSARILAESYAEPALIPPTPWLTAVAPPEPGLELERRGGRTRILLEPQGLEPRQWVVRVLDSGNWSVTLLPGHLRQIEAGTPEIVAVSAVDRLGNEGAVAIAWP